MAEATGQGGAAWNFPRVGRWGVTALPAGWTYVPDFGMRQNVPDPQMVSANVSLMEDKLAAGQTFAEYIAAQAKLMEATLKELKIAGPQPIAFPGAEEASLLLVRHKVRDSMDMLHVQNYARCRDWIGIITLTTPEVSLRLVRPDFDAFVKGLCILLPPATSALPV